MLYQEAERKDAASCQASDKLGAHDAAFNLDLSAALQKCVFRGSVSKVFGTIVSKYFASVSKVFVFIVSKFRPFPKTLLTLPKTLLTLPKS